MSFPREAYSRERSGDSQARRNIDRNQPVASNPMIVHMYSVIDVDFQVETKCEFNKIQQVLMILSSKRRWLLITALAQRIQHTERRSGPRVTPTLPENGSVERLLFDPCRQFGLGPLHRHIARTRRLAEWQLKAYQPIQARRASECVNCDRHDTHSLALRACIGTFLPADRLSRRGTAAAARPVRLADSRSSSRSYSDESDPTRCRDAA